jgi:hypothetical protein
MLSRNGSRLALLLGTALLLPGDGPSSGPPAPDPWKALNDASRQAYAHARREALARCGPVVLVEGDEVVLRYGVFRQAVRFSPPLYHDLKAIGHVPLALHALLAGREGEVPAERLFDLKRYHDLVRAAYRALPGRDLTEAQRQRQRKILTHSLAFLDGVLRHRRVTGKALTAYTRRLRPLLEANSADAARAQIDALHRQMTAWRARLTAEEWGRLKVIVQGSPLPRKDNLAVQYFARLLGETGEGGRIIYAESVRDEARALDLLGTHLVDTRIGADFFADPRRMHRDLLADVARQYLDELFRKGER